MADRFQTRMAWDGTGDGHWDVVLTEMVEGRVRVLATIPLDEWISLSATQYGLELHVEGEEVLRTTPPTVTSNVDIHPATRSSATPRRRG